MGGLYAEAAGTCLGVLCEPGDVAARETQRSAGVSGRRSRMLDFRGHSPISAYINKGGIAEDSVPVKGWNLRRATLLYYWPHSRRAYSRKAH